MDAKAQAASGGGAVDNDGGDERALVGGHTRRPRPGEGEVMNPAAATARNAPPHGRGQGAEAGTTDCEMRLGGNHSQRRVLRCTPMREDAVWYARGARRARRVYGRAPHDGSGWRR